LVSSQPHRQNLWSEFFELDRFTRARLGPSLTKAVARLEDGRCDAHPAYMGTSSLGVLEQMARLGVHRVPVVTEKGRVHGLVTQSMFISLFSQEMHRLGRLKNVFVSELVPSLTASPWLVDEQSLAINAFKLMAKHNVSGLGVVDGTGCLTGTISVSDLHGMGCKGEDFDRLWHPVNLFIRSTQTRRAPSTVMLLDSVETVIRRMHDGDIHHVFVVVEGSEGASVPVHVVTQRDVLKFLCKSMGVGYESSERTVKNETTC
jgi:CBS-domain-containing membrane protein